MSDASPVVVAVDPGSAKCGVAAVTRERDGTLRALHQAVVSRENVEALVAELCERFSPPVVLIGNATQSRPIRERLQSVLQNQITVEVVDEAHTSEQARLRYLKENPPQGRAIWQRLIPLTVRTPPRPVDDYVAVILAERWLREHSG